MSFRIVHVGAGAFMRAHQAWYLQKLRECGESDWSYTVGAIREDAVPLLEALEAQGGAYTLETVTPDGARSYESIRSIDEVIAWAPDARGIVEAGARAQTRIVTYTVTEAGYYLDAAGELDMRHPAVAADLDGARQTVYGTTAAILDARLEGGAGPVTLQSCDNIRGNGSRLEGALNAFLRARGATALPRWIADNVTFPNSMVDRITPAPGDALRARVFAATGIEDRCPVMSERFAQWVIEDRFAAGRPAWERAGAALVDDVEPYEEAKIRILNASHSAIAWAGALAGYRYIHEGIADFRIRDLVAAYVDASVIPTLGSNPLDLASYRTVVFERFTNPAIADTNERVASDSSAKINAFIDPTLRDVLRLGLPPESALRLPGLFYLFLERLAELPLTFRDAQLDAASVRAIVTAAAPVDAFLGRRDLWGELVESRAFREGVASAIDELRQRLPAHGGR